METRSHWTRIRWSTSLSHLTRWRDIVPLWVTRRTTPSPPTANMTREYEVTGAEHREGVIHFQNKFHSFHIEGSFSSRGSWSSCSWASFASHNLPPHVIREWFMFNLSTYRTSCQYYLRLTKTNKKLSFIYSPQRQAKCDLLPRIYFLCKRSVRVGLYKVANSISAEWSWKGFPNMTWAGTRTASNERAAPNRGQFDDQGGFLASFISRQSRACQCMAN